MRQALLIPVIAWLAGGYGWTQQRDTHCANVEKRRIVVTIGINNYPNWPALHSGVKDADDVEQLLVSKFGYESYCSLREVKCDAELGTKPLRDANASRDSINDVLDMLDNGLCDKDDLIFFYSGHGDFLPDPSNPSDPGRGTGYLVPFDAPAADQHKYSRFIPVSDLLNNRLKSVKAQNVLVILDACYSGIAIENSLNSRMGPGTDIDNDQQFIDSMAGKKSRKVITAALPQQTASDQGSRPGNSLFTGVLLDELESGQAAGKRSFIYSTGLGAALKTEVTVEAHNKNKEQTADFGPFDGDSFGELILPLHNDFDGLFRAALKALVDGDIDTFSVGVKQAVTRAPQNPLSTYLHYCMALATSDARGALYYSEALMTLPAPTFPCGSTKTGRSACATCGQFIGNSSFGKRRCRFRPLRRAMRTLRSSSIPAIPKRIFCQ